MSGFKELYKSGVIDLKDQQALRRAKLLEEQRKRREENFSDQREIKSKKRNYRRPEYAYKNCLMLSEWMMEIPDYLEEFLLVPCPKGIRCTLSNDVSRSICKLYYKNGTEFLSIRTNIPRNTILDCVYTKSTLFILDVIKYDKRDFIDCDTEFRKYWMRNKYMEDDLKIFNDDTEDSTLKLQIIEAYDFANSHNIQKCFNTSPIFDDKVELDGFLFYHKEAAYTVGESPLVLWLFPFMIPDVLPMFQVHSEYEAQKPENYTNYLDYIYEFNLKLKDKKKRFKKHPEKMDDADESAEQDEMQKMIDLERFGDFE